ncbi:HAD-IA family hydrolase [Candidatus Micrarchaeota archaeon]|nr:HAD-IA family hydrolase [Candidatus Micrarchaeota archaeon]
MKAALFDLDGTLANISLVSKFSKHHYLKVACAKAFGFLPRSLKPMAFSVIDLLEHAPTRKALFNRVLLKKIILMKKKGVKVGIVSSNTRHTVLACLHKAGFKKDFFDVIICINDVDFLKPDPDPLQKALKKLSVLPKDAVYYGDHWVDAEAAKAIGMKFVKVSSVKWA